MNSRFAPLATALAVVVPAAASAVTTTAPVIVTATRVAESVDETLAPVTVITREDIERRQARSLPELLQGTAGVGFDNTGGRGKVSTVFLRGTESDHVLVLINGIKVGSASSGLTPFQDLPVSQIERIEVVRGPRSHLYGSEAIGGVIQIFTRRGGGELAPSLSVGGGSDGTRSASLALSGGGDSAWFNIGVSGEQTDGFDACSGEPLVAGCFTVEPDDDGYENTSGSLRAGYRFAGGAEIDLSYLDSDNETEFDGDFQNQTETRQKVLGLGFNTMVGESLALKLNVGTSEDLSTNFKDGAFASRFDTERDSVSGQADWFTAGDGILTIGLDYLDDRVTSDQAFTETERDNLGLFGQYQGRFGLHDVQIGIRHDDNQQFGTETTGGITVGHQLSGGNRLTGSVGTAFKAPSFNELYFPGFGNPDLEPEESTSFEFGLESAEGNWALNVFQTDIDQLIGSDPDTFTAVNVDQARIRGIEAVLAASLGGWDASASLTLLDAENRSGGFRGNDLVRRAGEVLRLDADREFGRFSVGATLLAEGASYDDIANTRRIDSYAVVDLRGGVELSPGWLLQARIENLFDEDYETASFFNQPGRSGYLTLRYSPER